MDYSDITIPVISACDPKLTKRGCRINDLRVVGFKSGLPRSQVYTLFQQVRPLSNPDT
jgi:hypothetical protein